MPLFWLSLAFLAGLILAANLTLPTLGWILIGVTAALFLLPPFYRRWSNLLPAGFTQLATRLRITSPAIFPLILVFACTGAVRYLSTRPVITPESIAYYNDQPGEYVVEGLLAEPPDERDKYTNLRLQAQRLSHIGDDTFIPVHGYLLARTFTSNPYRYGDIIRLQGHIQTPLENEDFSYREYLANQGIYSTISYPTISLVAQGKGNLFLSAIYALRDRALSLLYRLLPDPEASLMAGILLGVESGIPAEVQEAFRLTGTSHIIVISGFNITIIAAFFTLLFRRLLGERRGAVVSGLAIIFYTILVGANPAVVRAAILGMLTLLGHQVGRRQAGLNSLAIIAAVMAFATPTILWDVSFQLSFAATLGIMLYAEPLTTGLINILAHVFPRNKIERLTGPLSAYIVLTLAAQVTTLPLMAYYFKRVSLTALLANPLILPAQPPLMVLGGMAVLTGWVFQPIGQLFAWAAWPFTAYTIRVVEWFAAIPHGSIPIGQVALPLILLFYATLFAITFTRSRLPSLFPRLSPAIPLMLLLVSTVLVWQSAFRAPDGLLHVTLLDVGTGEAVLIRSPAGRNLLINGGSSTIHLSEALGRRLPIFNRSLDWLVVADIDNEDLSGVSGNLERFPPANVLWAGNTYGTRSAGYLWSKITTQSIPVAIMQPGQSLDLGSGASLQVLFTNPRGAVLLLEWVNFRLLLPMGADLNALEVLQSNSAMHNISAMLLAESGYAPLNPPELISALHPQLALLSVAAGDKTGLPSPETIAALNGYNLLRTDQNGWIEIRTNGALMWVEVERK